MNARETYNAIQSGNQQDAQQAMATYEPANV